MKLYVKYLICSWVVLVSLTSSSNPPSFSKYQAHLFNGHKAKIKLKSNPLAQMFRTRISDTHYSKNYMNEWHELTGLNFGGHYCFAYWGCGSPCQQAAIVDVKTGIVYDAPAASYGYKFRPASRLVVVNPDDPHTGCAGCTTEYWVLNELSKKFEQVH
jgi:hypothetical protein